MKIFLALLSAGLLTAGSAHALTNVSCIASANDLTNALAALSTSTSNSDADEIRIRVGTYFAPAGGWIGAVANHHDLAVRGGYTDAACTQRSLDASATVLDGNHAAGVLTINATAIPLSNIEVSNLTFQNGAAAASFQTSAGGLKVGDPGPISGGNVLIERNIFRDNTGTVGGLLAATDGDSLIVRNNLFVGNSAPNDAAAFLFSNNRIRVSNNTFTLNQTTDTMQTPHVMLDFFSATGLDLTNNVFWHDVLDANTFDVNLSGQFAKATLANNDIEATTGTAVSISGALHLDPQFAGAANFRPAYGSPLIDAGIDTVPGGAADADLDGAPRTVGVHIDIGAYESGYLFANGFE